LEEAGKEFGLSSHIVPFDPRYLPLSDHRHCLKSRHCSSRRLETAEAKPWPGQPFDASMILLDDVIEVFDLTQFAHSDEAGQGFRPQAGTCSDAKPAGLPI
jgi:hypothetical protein